MQWKHLPETQRNRDLACSGELVLVDMDLCPEETVQVLADYFAHDETDRRVYVPASHMDEFAIPYEAIDFLHGFYDAELRRECLSEYLNAANHYLVFAAGYRWDGSSGYKFCDDIADTVARNYDCHIYPEYISSRKKALACTESSHDVPMGSRTWMIALTDREYSSLKHAPFEKVSRYVEQMLSNKKRTNTKGERL